MCLRFHFFLYGMIYQRYIVLRTKYCLNVFISSARVIVVVVLVAVVFVNQAMEFVHNGPVMVWEESTGQYVSPATGGVLPPKTAAGYFRGMLDGLVSVIACKHYSCSSWLCPYLVFLCVRMMQ